MGAEERLAEIESRFAKAGYELIVHPVAHGGFFATYIRFESRSGNVAFTWGETALEAAESAEIQHAASQTWRA